MSIFPQQIKGVPPKLVAQGWRREPTDAVIDEWTGDQRQHYRWESITVRDTENKRIQILRPIARISGSLPAWDGGCGVYAHQGWGDGLAPTPEMCEVWKWWWANSAPVLIELIGGTLWCGDDWCGELSCQWAGPVLPPVGVV